MIQHKIPVARTFIWGILCTKCGWLYIHSSTSSINIISYRKQCVQCNFNTTKAIQLPLNYFNDKSNTLYLTKAEMVELLI